MIRVLLVLSNFDTERQIVQLSERRAVQLSDIDKLIRRRCLLPGDELLLHALAKFDRGYTLSYHVKFVFALHVLYILLDRL